MDFDAYTSYTDSAPRTPSPPSSDYSDSFPGKESLENHRVFVQEVQDDIPETHAIDLNYWHASESQSQNPFAFNPSSRGSLLQELYESEGSPSDDLYMDRPSSNASSFRPDSSDSHFEPPTENWRNHTVDGYPQQQPQFFQNREYTPMRRNTFPYVRHDLREQSTSPHPYPAFIPHEHRHDTMYNEPLPLAADPSSLQGEQYGSPHSSYHDFDESNGVKLEDSPTIVPSGPFYRPSSSGGHSMSLTYISPDTGLPVQYTDDAASKETQYLRRRCFNCHTTEPPSWRRSTLNPGKIVCNKCGLYERTHLRPRPLRFDELRAGNKARKQTKALSPKAKLLSANGIKKEPREYAIVRRNSVSSNSSASGSSDWEDNVSLYSNSTPSSSYNSPSIPSFPIPRDSESPPVDGAIRLPNAPLSDIASLQRRERSLSAASAHSHGQARRKAHTSGPYFNPGASNSSPHLMLSPPDFYRRPSMPNMRGEAAVWAERSSPLGSELMQRDDQMLMSGTRLAAVAS